MLAVAIARRPGKHGYDDLGAEPAHDVEDVLEDGVARPEAQRLVERLGIAEVVGAREKLARAVDPAGGEQLFRADDAELGTELGADEVLPALAAAQRQVGHPGAHPTGEHGDEDPALLAAVAPD